jgi:hypothetical protein
MSSGRTRISRVAKLLRGVCPCQRCSQKARSQTFIRMPSQNGAPSSSIEDADRPSVCRDCRGVR